MKRFYFLTLIIIILSLLCGCWNYREINQFYLVGGMGIDYHEEHENYHISVETVKVSGQGAQATGTMYYAEGKTIFDGIRAFVVKTGRRLFWGHSKVLIISKELAQRGIAPLLDMTLRDAEIRSDMWILISGEKTAGDILGAKRSKMHNLNSFQLHHTMDLGKNSSEYYDIKIWQIVRELYAEGISPVVPIVELSGQGDSKRIKVSGVAVFKGDKMIGALDEAETEYFLLLKNRLRGGLFTLPIWIDDKNKNINITFKIFNCKTKIKPVISGGKIKMVVTASIAVGIAEVDGQLDFIDKVVRDSITFQAQKILEENIGDLVNKIQNDYKSDILGFGSRVILENPSYWKNKRYDWNEVFPEIELETKVDLLIKSSALAKRATGIRQ